MNSLRIGKKYTFAPANRARPAPAELPQGRKAARVGSCSGAMFGLPFFFAGCPPLGH